MSGETTNYLPSLQVGAGTLLGLAPHKGPSHFSHHPTVNPTDGKGTRPHPSLASSSNGLSVYRLGLAMSNHMAGMCLRARVFQCHHLI